MLLQSLQRFWIMFRARNYEFFRDRAAFGWNFLFPFLLVVGFGLIFGQRPPVAYKIGVFPTATEQIQDAPAQLPPEFRRMQYLQFVGFPTAANGLDRLRHHKIDLLIDLNAADNAYWVNDDSPKGYMAERLYNAALNPQAGTQWGTRAPIAGRQIRYIEWLLPGILAMNMMFSALWGVGYVVVRYRKNGTLKRLKATPVTAFEYICAQMLSRIFLLMFTFLVVWIGCDWLFPIQVEGSYVDLMLVFLLGSLCLTSMGLVLAARGTSEEFTTGVLNFISWPMMFLSEVWFSLEGAPQWIKSMAQIFPLTHLLSGARQIINDGATLWQITPELAVMGAMTLLFMGVGAALFKWN